MDFLLRTIWIVINTVSTVAEKDLVQSIKNKPRACPLPQKQGTKPAVGLHQHSIKEERYEKLSSKKFGAKGVDLWHTGNTNKYYFCHCNSINCRRSCSPTTRVLLSIGLRWVNDSRLRRLLAKPTRQKIKGGKMTPKNPVIRGIKNIVFGLVIGALAAALISGGL